MLAMNGKLGKRLLYLVPVAANRLSTTSNDIPVGPPASSFLLRSKFGSLHCGSNRGHLHQVCRPLEYPSNCSVVSMGGIVTGKRLTEIFTMLQVSLRISALSERQSSTLQVKKSSARTLSTPRQLRRPVSDPPAPSKPSRYVNLILHQCDVLNL